MPCTPAPSFLSLPRTSNDDGRRERKRERQVSTRVSGPSWACLSVVGSNHREDGSALSTPKKTHVLAFPNLATYAVHTRCASANGLPGSRTLRAPAALLSIWRTRGEGIPEVGCRADERRGPLGAGSEERDGALDNLEARGNPPHELAVRLHEHRRRRGARIRRRLDAQRPDVGVALDGRQRHVRAGEQPRACRASIRARVRPDAARQEGAAARTGAGARARTGGSDLSGGSRARRSPSASPS